MVKHDRRLFWQDDTSDVEGNQGIIKQELIDRIYKYFDEVNEVPVVYHWKYKMDNFGKDDISLAN